MIDTKSIREKIIDLAISGKLTEHYEGDSIIELENATRILGNKERRYIDDSEKWTDIPSNWDWTTLASITNSNYLGDGNWVLSSDMVANGEVRLIQLGCIGDCVFKHKGFKYLTEEHFKELNGKQIYPGYLLINRLVVDKMVACIIPEIKGILCTAVDVCWVAPNSGIYDIQYLMYALSSTEFRRTVKELGHGVTRFRISKLNLIDIAFPFPPLAEQKRIVSAVEDAFAVIDRIEKAQESYYADQEVLKNKIIDAGTRGKLTEQLPEDGNAEDLYAQIQEEKARLIAEGKIKIEKPLPPITEEEIPFEIPENWKWVRLGNYCQKVTDQVASGSFASLRENVKSLKTKDYALMVKTADFANGFTENLTYTDKHGYEFLNNSNLFGGELILSNIGSIGKCFIVPKLEIKMTLAPNSIMLRLTSDELRDYLYYFLLSSQGFIELEGISTGVAVKKFNKTDLKGILIPIPPLAEQKRIAEMIDKLLSVLS